MKIWAPRLCAAILATLVHGAAEAGSQAPPAVEAAREFIAEIHVHGNNVTPDADVLALAGVSRGDAFTASTLAVVRRRIAASRRFEGVEVLKRYASIADASQIALVIVVDEHAVRVLPPVEGAAGGDPVDRPVRIVRRRVFTGAMFLPIVDFEDGYGLTYGAVVAYPGVGGERGRLSFPLSWGGSKHAGVEYERPFATGPVGRVRGGTSVERRTNPAFEEEDDRTRVWARAETPVKWNMNAGATSAVERVSFSADRETWRSNAVDMTLDTRRDPVFPRNAVYALASRTHLRGETTGAVNRLHVDLRGFVGLVGAPVVVLRLERDTSDRALPSYFKPLLGGWSSLRGFAAGSFTGDNRLVTSVELRVPVSSPLSVARAGFSVFFDRGKAYDAVTAFAHAPWREGFGAGVWLSATLVRVGVSVAHGRGGETRLTAGIGMGH